MVYRHQQEVSPQTTDKQWIVVAKMIHSKLHNGPVFFQKLLELESLCEDHLIGGVFGRGKFCQSGGWMYYFMFCIPAENKRRNLPSYSNWIKYTRTYFSEVGCGELQVPRRWVCKWRFPWRQYYISRSSLFFFFWNRTFFTIDIFFWLSWKGIGYAWDPSQLWPVTFSSGHLW